MVTHNKLQKCKRKQNLFCDCFRSKQMSATDQNTSYTLHLLAPISELPSNIDTMSNMMFIDFWTPGTGLNKDK